MQKPPIPHNEQSRLQDLNAYEILDTLEEEDFDFLTSMASKICGTHISLISLIDHNRQWFKSHHGLEIRETPKDFAFCAHALYTANDIFVVPDARLDERFFDNPLVIGKPHVIFYAGVPLVTKAGYALGTLCAIHDQPMTLTNEQKQMLLNLARQVVNLLELKKIKKDIEAEKLKLEVFFEQNLDLLVIADFEGKLLKINHEWTASSGYTMNELSGKNFLELVHPDDVEDAIKIYSQIINHEKILNFTNRYRTANGQYRTLEWRAQRSGKLVYASARDISEKLREKHLLHELASRNDAIMASLNKNTIVSIADSSGNIIYANAMFSQVSGYTPSEFLNRNHNIVNSGYHPKAFWSNMWKTIRSGQTWRDEVCNRAKDDSLYWVDTVIHPIADEAGKPFQYIAIRYLITERKEAERQLVKASELLEQTGKMAKIGAFEMDLEKNTLYWSPVTKQIHEVADDYVPELETAINFYKQGENRKTIENAIIQLLDNGTPFDKELLIVTALNNEKWVRVLGSVEQSYGRFVRLYGTFQDIDEQVKSRQAVHNEKLKSENIIEGTNVGTWEYNVQTGETVYNERWANMVGYTLQELAPTSIKTWMELVHPDDRSESENRLQDCYDRKVEYYEFETRIKHKNGTWIWVLDKGKVLEWTNDGKPLMMYGTHVDITAMKHAQEQITHHNLFMESVLNTVEVGIVACDAEGKLILFNKATKQWHGLPPEPINSTKFADYYSLYQSDHITPLKPGEVPLVRTFNGEQVLHQEMVIAPKGLPARLVICNGAQLRNEKGNLAGAVVAMQDVTRIREAEHKLRISEEAFRGSFENAGIGMALVGLKGEWLKVNPRLCALLGYTADELMQLTFIDITHPEDLDTDLGLLNQLIDGKIDHYHMEKRYFHKKGSVVYIILSVSMVKDPAGNILHFISQIVDITARKEAEFKLKETLSNIQAILNASTGVSIIGTSVHGLIHTFNKGAENLLGYKAEEIVGQFSPLILHSTSEVEERRQKLSEVLNRQIDPFEVFITSTDGMSNEVRQWTYINKDGSLFRYY